MKASCEQSVGIVGFGRFGRLLARLVKTRFDGLLIHDRKGLESGIRQSGSQAVDLRTVCEADTVFLAVPIRELESVLQSIAPLARPGQVFIDVASVKVRPRNWMLDLLPQDCGVLNIHPMFGPDSFDQDPEPRLVYCPTRIKPAAAEFWRAEFHQWGCRVLEMSPEEHDRLAARTQGITHFIGRVMQAMEIQPTVIDTLGFRQIHQVVEQTCQDSEELFIDLQTRNPYTPAMLQAFKNAVDQVSSRLLAPDSVPPRIGYQGAEGSFSEEAAHRYAQRGEKSQSELIPCVTSKGVIQALMAHEIDLGIMALENARGGVVTETIIALAESRCEAVDLFPILVEQCLLVPANAPGKTIYRIISHPQALRQCAGYLDEHFPGIPRIDAEDTALAAYQLAEGRLDPGSAVIAPRRAAELYGLTVHQSGIQDLGADNQTTFLVVTRLGSEIQLLFQGVGADTSPLRKGTTK